MREKGSHTSFTQIAAVGVGENRICTFCNLRYIENEYHFVLVCVTYTNISKKHAEVV